MDENTDERVRRCFYAIDADSGAARADLFRVCILFHEGGIWTDHKASLKWERGWPELLERLPQPTPSLLLSTWGNHNMWKGCLDASPLLGRGEICNGFIGSAAKHPVLGAILDGICTNIEKYAVNWNFLQMFPDYRPNLVGKGGVLWLTGPLALSTIA